MLTLLIMLALARDLKTNMCIACHPNSSQLFSANHLCSHVWHFGRPITGFELLLTIPSFMPLSSCRKSIRLGHFPNGKACLQIGESCLNLDQMILCWSCGHSPCWPHLTHLKWCCDHKCLHFTWFEFFKTVILFVRGFIVKKRLYVFFCQYYYHICVIKWHSFNWDSNKTELIWLAVAGKAPITWGKKNTKWEFLCSSSDLYLLNLNYKPLWRQVSTLRQA